MESHPIWEVPGQLQTQALGTFNTEEEATRAYQEAKRLSWVELTD